MRTVGSHVGRIPNCSDSPDPPPPHQGTALSAPPPPRGLRPTVSWAGSWRPDSSPPPPLVGLGQRGGGGGSTTPETVEHPSGSNPPREHPPCRHTPIRRGRPQWGKLKLAGTQTCVSASDTPPSPPPPWGRIFYPPLSNGLSRNKSVGSRNNNFPRMSSPKRSIPGVAITD